ncbi:flagellar basal body rod protein FlgB [bacterium]|nr:MAG: flagellar basal body rod protein FlgB [bacterium]
MLDGIFSGHLGNLERGLNRTVQRQGLLMTNLSNANVPGYKRKDVDFNIALEEEMGAGSKFDSSISSQGGVTESEGSIRYDGSSVDPEQEALGIAQTELRYQTLADLTAGYFSGLKNVIREGK